MAHRVMNHGSKCKNLHGHRYAIEVGVDDKVIDKEGEANEGMVIDFGDLKNIMMTEIDAVFDHNSIFSVEDPIKPFIEEIAKHQNKVPIFVHFIPTAENLAKFWYKIIEPNLKDVGIKIKYVRVFETPTSTATYEEN